MIKTTEKNCNLGTPLLEDLLFDRNNVRTKALANQIRVGTVLVCVRGMQLTIPRSVAMHKGVLTSTGSGGG